MAEEACIRDYLATQIHRFPSLISNLAAINQSLDAEKASFNAIGIDQGGPTPVDLIRRILSKRHLQGLGSLTGLELIGKEFAMLSTGKGGFQPSADILARCSFDNRLFVIEVKRSIGTERQAVTELSAYTHGLNLRFWNLTPADYVWVPICTDWRTTVLSAFAGEALWQRRPVLPMRCKVGKGRTGAVKSVELECISLLDDIEEPLALSQFAWDCFDVITFELSKKPSSKRTLLELISSIAAREGFSGVVMYGESLGKDVFPYPYVYALAVHNPFRAALKRRQLQIVLDDRDVGGRTEMRKQVKEPLWFGHDIDFRTMKDRDPEILDAMSQQAAEAGRKTEAKRLSKLASEDYLSVEEMADLSRNRIGRLFDEVKERLDMFCSFESSHPLFKLFFEQSVPVLIDHVSYFGLMQEAVLERLQWEASKADRGDGPILGAIGGDPVYALGSFDLFDDFMSLMNFEHDCQTDYEDESEAHDDDQEDSQQQSAS